MSPRPSLLRASLLGALLLTAACGLTARSGPTATAITAPPDGDATYEVVQLSAETLGRFAAPPHSPFAIARAAPAAQPAYAIRSGDVLNIIVFERSDGGLFAPAASGGSAFPAVRVAEDGTVTLPYAGRVNLGGASLSQAGGRIAQALAGTAIDPRVHVQLGSSAAHSVLVAGEVRTPGRISLLDGPLTALDAIARAGGPAQPSHALDVVIQGPGGTQRMSYLELLGQPALRVGMGEQIVLEPHDKRVLVLGAVRRPGVQPMTLARMSLLDGIAAAGGLNDLAANPSGVFLFRMPEGRRDLDSQPTVVQLDMARGDAMLLAHAFQMRRDDILYVSNAPLWEVQKLVAPFIQLLTLGASAAAAGG